MTARKGNGAAGEPAPGNGAAPPPPPIDDEILNEFERLERENILDDDDDAPGSDAEPTIIPVVDRIPKFTRFRVNPDTVFEMWGTVDDAGMDKTVITATKGFAATLEEEIDLRRVRFYETTTPDQVPRLMYCFLPDSEARTPNLWLASKLTGMELAKVSWVTMLSRKKLGQFQFRRCQKDHGEPRFSGLSRGELIQHALLKPGLLVADQNHPFYRKAADLDDE